MCFALFIPFCYLLFESQKRINNPTQCVACTYIKTKHCRQARDQLKFWGRSKWL